MNYIGVAQGSDMQPMYRLRGRWLYSLPDQGGKVLFRLPTATLLWLTHRRVVFDASILADGRYWSLGHDRSSLCRIFLWTG